MAAVASAATVTRFVGNCQLCEGDFKLTADRVLVHHGYRRPGWGSIVGDCPGVSAPPYEVSCEQVKAYLVELRGALSVVVAQLATIRAGELHHLTVESRGVFLDLARGVSDAYAFDEALRGRAWTLERRESAIAGDVARCERRVAAWTPKALRTVEEDAAKHTTVKAERAAVVAAARAARDAKRAATKAKQKALEDRRAAVLEAFRARLRELATLPPDATRNAAADKLYAEMTSKKCSWFYFSDFHTPDLFVAVGLASWEGGPENRNGHGDRFVRFHRTDGSDRRW